MSLKNTRRSRSGRPASKSQKKQMGGLMFGNVVAHQIILAAGIVLQRDYGFDQQQTAEFVSKVTAQVREDIKPNPPAPQGAAAEG